MIRAPTGKSANLACLKCCSPNGIPTMVRHNAIPNTTSSRTITNPPNTNQIIFSKSEPPLSLNCMSFPNGAAAIVANLKHCLPIGKPIIVIDHKTPNTIHEIQLIKPPKINHMIFNKNVIRTSPF